jgi:hypothetical protein
MPKKPFEWRHLDKFTRDDDWDVVMAYDAWLAAKAAADKWDQEERHMIRDGHGEVFEIRDQDGVVTRWSVYGEAEPIYYASPLTP